MKNLYLIIGRSGSGKSTIVNELKRIYGYTSVDSYTTRPPRGGHEEGHTFISKEEFNKKKLLAYTFFDGYEYGVDKELLKNADFYIIDIEGAKRLKELYKDKPLITVNIRCSYIIENMLSRGDSMEQIVKRIENDKIMFANEDVFPFDYTLNNNLDMSENINKMQDIINDAENGEETFAKTSDDIIENK